MRMIPERTSIRSNSGQERRNSRYSSSVQKPMTRSTPARLYQLRSKQDHLAGRRQVSDVALEIPLAPLALGRRRQRHDPGVPRIEAQRDGLDRAALAGRVAAFEDDGDLEPFVADPLLELDELDLEPGELAQVDLVRDGPDHRTDLLDGRIRPDVGELAVLPRPLLLGPGHRLPLASATESILRSV